MKKSLVILGLMLGILLITNVSAGIYFSQPEQTYNMGDIIVNDINIEPVEEGFLKVDLVCEGDALNVFNGVPVDGGAHIEFPLTTVYIQNISGVCSFLGYYDGQEKESREFKISRKLNVRLDIDSLFAKPSEQIIVSGTAERLNGEGVDGEVEVRVIGLINNIISSASDSENNETETEGNETTDENNETETDDETTDENNETETEDEEVVEITEIYDSGVYSGRVSGGKFSVNFTIGKDTPANDYKIEVLVYESDSNGEKTSEGIESANLKVSQVLRGIDIALSEQSLNPGSELSFKPRLLDQSGRNIDGEVSVIIRDEDLNRIFEKIVMSEETINYEIPGNISAGYYELEASNGNISDMKKFYIKEKAIVSFRLENETLIVINTGNVPYNKDIQIELDGKPFVKKMSLELGEIKEFKLTGSDEEYDIKITDGETELVQGGVVLTGNAIGVKELRSGAGAVFKTPIVWIFVIIILGGVVLFIFRNVFKKKSFAYPFKGKFGKKKIKDLKIEKSEGAGKQSEKGKSKTEKEIQKPGALVAPSQAEQVLVLKGQKNKAAVLVLKIKNKLSKVSKESLEKAIEPIYEKRGAVYEQGDFIYIIYSPLMTRTFKNEVEAAKAAEKIKLVLQEHNKKFKDKIDFGIGINSGDIINKVEDKKLKFTALGNLITNAKRLAESSTEQVLVTKEAYEKGISEIKADKKEIKGSEVYEVRNVVDKEKNAQFIKGFLDRLGDKK